MEFLPPPFPAEATHPMAFFERLSETCYLPTEHTGGAWNIREQHIAPAIGLLAHHLERDAEARGHGFLIARLSYDILGTIPIEAMEADVQVLRGGRTIELVEATLRHDDRPALRARLVDAPERHRGHRRHADSRHSSTGIDAGVGPGHGLARWLHPEHRDPSPRPGPRPRNLLGTRNTAAAG
ncbi:acyl-CoA thioesterase domain-containing protein [Stenotrophomonas forensis]|uniref:acyl-CoA thioesterase domain-containing protein n=1 Tax=Stenotrophomonas forensis TaxID=2871169 RepID=UPI0039C60D52